MALFKILAARWKKLNPELKYILLLFIITRVLLTVIGVISRTALRPNAKQFTQFLWLNIWGVWDSDWYLGIAEKGYSAELTAGNQAAYNFFPLYPNLMKIIGVFTQNYYVAGVLISNIALIVACVFLYKLVCLESDKKTALRSVKYLFLFPSAFILSGVLSEGLFLALMLSCFYYAKRRNWFWAGCLGFFAALTKSLGVIILIPLIYEYTRSAGFKFKKFNKSFFYLLLVPAGTFVFSVQNYFLTGDFLAFVHIAQTGWKHQVTNPFFYIFENLISDDIYNIANAVFISVVIILLLFWLKKIDFTYWLLAIFLIFVPLSSGECINSMFRYTAAIFPLFIICAKWSTEPKKDQMLMISLALLQGFLMAIWVLKTKLIV